MSDELTFFAAIVGFLVVIAFLKIRNCFYPAAFFVVKFMAGQFIDFDRVRNQVAFQLLIIFFLIIIVAIKSSGIIVIKDQLLSRYFPLIGVFLLFNIAIGLLFGHYWFQTLIDSYKYLDILVYYMLFRACWVDNEDLFKGLNALCCVMLVLGVIELFLTERGGSGLNLIVSFFPMTFLLALNDYNKHYKLIFVISMLVVFMCQTRVYIVGFILGYVMLLYLAPNDNRKKAMNLTVILVSLSLVATFLIGFNLFSGTVSRFMELSEGFSESGGYRINEYRVAIDRFLDSPILGNGFGYLKNTYIEKMGYIDWGDFIHCVYIEILFKTGLLGMSCVIVFFVSFFRRLIEEFKFLKTKRNSIFFVCCGGICSLISWMAIYTFDPLSSYGSVFVGVIVACIAISNYYDEIEQEKLGL